MAFPLFQNPIPPTGHSPISHTFHQNKHNSQALILSTPRCCTQSSNSAQFFPEPHTNPSGTLILPPSLTRFVTSTVLLMGFGVTACSFSLFPPKIRQLPTNCFCSMSIGVIDLCKSSNLDNGEIKAEKSQPMRGRGTQFMESYSGVDNLANEEMKAAFEEWKSKTYALTVPLRIITLRGSVPPSWIKDFVQVQGKRLKLRTEFRSSLEAIFSELTSASKKNQIEAQSTMAADLITIGDSWMNLAICEGIIEPILDAEEQDWYSSLPDKWKVYLRRNKNGQLDPRGKIWGAPYRWGSMVIAYNKTKFERHNVAPIEDWKDLWRPELAGKISMVDAPREVLGAVLKYMGASYNSNDFSSQVSGGRTAVLQKFSALRRQVRLFDSMHYLKAFGAGDVWVAVGWSSDVLPAAKRMPNVTVVVPKSGTSLWADLWAIPAASTFATDRIGGRVRGPSPLIHQWIEFCLQPARALPFCQEIVPGASPLALTRPYNFIESLETTSGAPKLETNLIAGLPPPEILCKCEFLEPLSKEAFVDYQWLIAHSPKTSDGWIGSIMKFFTSTLQHLKYAPFR
ncbi:uncharacterized protein LOC18443994 isoform X1 [Amborella trichopoda]|nr:uncharacterized protein LOC18443994 isoform X1 [Amborella trichopoda]|eukprot:XP_006854235.2 uncharacterized protein LOC18443994 isoform X1 [Amborella trichopoda]